MIAPGFDGYLSLKKEYSFIRHKVRFDSVLAVQLIQVAYKRVDLNKNKLKQTAKLLYKTLDVSSLKQAFANNRVISSYINRRKDYDELLKGYFENVPDHQSVFLPAMPYQTKLSALNIITAFSFVFLKPHSGNLRQKFYIACYFVHYLNILDSLTKAFKDIDLFGKKYAPFNSSFDVETLLSQFFKLKGADTYHISHGISYVKYNNLPDFAAVNGENITAENILVWGETSRNDLVDNYEIDSGAITITGNPKYPHKKINVNTDFKTAVVFLGAPIYDDNNKKLIALIAEITKETNIKFVVKAHPSSDIGFTAHHGIVFLSSKESIADVLAVVGYDFAVSYNSTVYYEAMYCNLPCLRYAVEENGAFEGLDDKFCDKASFIERMTYFSSAPPAKLNKDIEQLLVANLGMGINQYGYIFNNNE